LNVKLGPLLPDATLEIIDQLPIFFAPLIQPCLCRAPPRPNPRLPRGHHHTRGLPTAVLAKASLWSGDFLVIVTFPHSSQVRLPTALLVVFTLVANLLGIMPTHQLPRFAPRPSHLLVTKVAVRVASFVVTLASGSSTQAVIERGAGKDILVHAICKGNGGGAVGHTVSASELSVLRMLLHLLQVLL
jgi:hypothetical protein